MQQRRLIESETARHRVDRDNMRNGADGLEILLLSETGSDDTAMQDFANDLENNISIGSSWLDAVYYANNGNNPTVANTGTNASNCWSRQGVTVNQVMSEPVLRDANVGYYCWTNWGSGPE